MGFNESEAQTETIGSVAAPYVRQNRSSDLTLSTTWQRIDFNGSSTRNANTYPVVQDTNKLVEWDSTDKVFKFYNSATRNYDVVFNFHVNSSTIISLLNLTMTNIQFRFVVPSPTPRYFPLPDDGGYIDLGMTGLASDVRDSVGYIVRAVADVQQYGIGLEIRIAGLALGTIVLKTADVSLYGR